MQQVRVSKMRWATAAMAAAVGLATLVATPAMASVAFMYVTDTPNPTVTPGQPVTMKVYLRQILTGGSTSVLAPNLEDGLSGVGVKVTETSGNATITGGALNTTDFVGLTKPLTITGNGTAANFEETIDANAHHGNQPGNTGGGVSPNTPANDFYLGNFVIQPGTQNSTFKLTQYDTSGNNTVTYTNILDLDAGNTDPSAGPVFTGTNAAPGIFSVPGTAVPEPASMAVLGVLGLGLVARRRQRQANA